ncbi:MAG: hypothetical protein EBQ96_09410 [Proteobacteria bacterium]|nr:hypothetical protein [Pseudomonadota bacterium]
MNREEAEPQIRGPFKVYTGGKAQSPLSAPFCDRRRASSAVNELFWAMNQCVEPDGFKPEALKNLALSLDARGSEIWIATWRANDPLDPVVVFRPLITGDWQCRYQGWMAQHKDVYMLVALAHRQITAQGFALPAISALKKLTTQLALP